MVVLAKLRTLCLNMVAVLANVIMQVMLFNGGLANFLNIMHLCLNVLAVGVIRIYYS